MKNAMLFAAVLAFAAQAGSAAEPAKDLPKAIQCAVESQADAVSRAERAIAGYVSAWAARDAQRLNRVMTDDAVVDFALDEPGTFLTVQANSLTGDCALCAPSWSARTRISNLRVFPTHDRDAVFVQYDTISDNGGISSTQHQLALVELRGERIARIRNFAEPPVSLVARNVAPGVIRPADRAPGIALR